MQRQSNIIRPTTTRVPYAPPPHPKHPKHTRCGVDCGCWFPGDVSLSAISIDNDIRIVCSLCAPHLLLGSYSKDPCCCWWFLGCRNPKRPDLVKRAHSTQHSTAQSTQSRIYDIGVSKDDIQVRNNDAKRVSHRVEEFFNESFKSIWRVRI